MADSKAKFDALLSKSAAQLDYFQSKPLPYYNPSTVNEYFKTDHVPRDTKHNSELSSLASSKRTQKSLRRKEDETMIVSITEGSQKVLIQSVGNYFRFFCDIQKKRIVVKEVENLFHSPIKIEFTNPDIKFAKELMVSFEYMFKIARLKPVTWFMLLVSWKGTNNLTMTLTEFIAGTHKLSDELKLPHWNDEDIIKLFHFVSDYQYSHIYTYEHPTGNKTPVNNSRNPVGNANSHANQNRASIFIKKIDLIVAFRKYRLSSKKIAALNHTASMVSKLNEFMALRSIHLRSYLQATAENDRVRSITLDELDTVISILLSDFAAAHGNKHNSSAVLNKSGADSDMNSGISELSQSSQLPGYMKFGIPRKFMTNSFLHLPADKRPKILPHLTPLHPREVLQRRQQEKEEHMRNINSLHLAPLGSPGSHQSGEQQSPLSLTKRTTLLAGSLLSGLSPISTSKSFRRHGTFMFPGRSRAHSAIEEEGDEDEDGYSDDSQYTYSDEDSYTEDFSAAEGGPKGGGSHNASFRNHNVSFKHNNSNRKSPHGNSHNNFTNSSSSSALNRKASIFKPQEKYNFHSENMSHTHNIYQKEKNKSTGKADPNLILKNDSNLSYYQSVVDNFDRRIQIAKRRLVDY